MRKSDPALLEQLHVSYQEASAEAQRKMQQQRQQREQRLQRQQSRLLQRQQSRRAGSKAKSLVAATQPPTPGKVSRVHAEIHAEEERADAEAGHHHATNHQVEVESSGDGHETEANGGSGNGTDERASTSPDGLAGGQHKVVDKSDGMDKSEVRSSRPYRRAH